MEKHKAYLTSEKTFVVILSALLISLPLPYAFSTTFLIVFVVAALASTLYHQITFSKKQLIPIFFYGLLVLSLSWSVNFDDSLRGLERQLPFLLLPIAFITMPVLSKKGFQTILHSFAVFLSLLALFFIANAFVQYLSTGNKDVFFYHALVSPLNLNAIYASVMASLSFLYVLFYSKRKFFNYLVAFVLFLFLILLASKNIIAVTFLAVIIGFFFTKKINRKRLLLIAFVGFGIAAVLFYSPVKERVEEELTSNVKEVLTCDKFNRVYPWTGTTIRLFQARVFYELFEENNKFLSGFGINASQEKIVEKQNTYNLYWGYNNYNFHNQYIQAFAELGFFGFIGILALLIVIFGKYISSKELIALFFVLIMGSVFLTESYVWRQRGMLHFLVLYGLLFRVFSVKLNNSHKRFI